MVIKTIIIRIFYSCDGLRGFFLDTGSFLCSSRIRLFQIVGGFLAKKNKDKRLQSIRANSAQKVSIILPAFNSEKTIDSTIKSIQAQSYKYWELLIIDDGSTDSTLEIAIKAAKEDLRVRIYQNRVNKGVAYTRNVGMHHATGDYIAFQDADDISFPERLEYMLVEFLSSLKFRVVISQYIRIDSEGKSLIMNGRTKRNHVSGMMFKRNLIKTVGYFKALNISEDSEYYERILATYGKSSRKVICKVLYGALFSPESLLFSNAIVSVRGNSVNYQIHDKELLELEGCRLEHERIRANELTPYQPFILDEEVTQIAPYE